MIKTTLPIQDVGLTCAILSAAGEKYDYQTHPDKNSCVFYTEHDLDRITIEHAKLEDFIKQEARKTIHDFNQDYAGPDPIPDAAPGITQTVITYENIITPNMTQQLIMQNQTKILYWSENINHDFLACNIILNKYITAGVYHHEDMIREIKTKDIRAIFYKQPKNTNTKNIHILAIYPDITINAPHSRPTGRDITEYIKTTGLYKNCNAQARYVLQQKVKRGITH